MCKGNVHLLYTMRDKCRSFLSAKNMNAFLRLKQNLKEKNKANVIFNVIKNKERGICHIGKKSPAEQEALGPHR